jgi:radical SAM superfamily enzyme YgiQ (UPF0313 family)
MFCLSSFDKKAPFTEASLIFYTLKGPSYKLEISENSLKLVKKSWFQFFTPKPHTESWEIDKLSVFEMSSNTILGGKLQWQTFEGVEGSFRFSTSTLMVKKIETYLQKKVIKNHQNLNALKNVAPTTKSKKKVA